MNQNDGTSPGPRHSSSNRSKWVLFGFFAIAGYFLYLEHEAHLAGYLQYLPYLLLLACPLLHLFMHGGHGGQGHGNHRHGTTPADREKPK